MKIPQVAKVILPFVASAALFAGTQAYAQDVIVSVKVKSADLVTSTTQIVATLDKRTEIQASARYKLKVLPTLSAPDMICLDVQVTDAAVSTPMSVVTRVKI